MDSITLDITGFYYSKTFTGEQLAMVKGKTVEELTWLARGMIGDGKRGKLTEVEFKPGMADPSDSFLQTLTVDFNKREGEDIKAPRSRQINSPSGNPPRGVYSYSDTLTNVVNGNGISFTPVWQYYVFNKDKQLQSGAPANDPTARKIVPANKSAGLEIGDRVVWRLVLIGGVFERISCARLKAPEVAEKARQQGATAIQAMSMLKSEIDG
ncbi:MAG: hypothetical protein AAF664_18965 [Planctomycetota bacterium]